MPSRFLLSYAVNSILIKEMKDGFQKDQDMYLTNGTGDTLTKTRINVPRILDGWNYTVRDFPCIVVTGFGGQNRRMGIGDSAAVPYFGVSGQEDQSVATPVYRKFWVSDVIAPGQTVNVTYTGDNATSPAEWAVLVQEETIGATTKRYIELEGTAIGPNSAYPRENFSIICNSPSAEQYGGFFDMRPEIYVVALSPVEREIVLDKLWSILWFSKKRELLYKGIVILDVSYAGNSQEDYGADKLYIGRLSVSCATEFRQLVYYLDTVEGIKVQGEAVVPVLL